SDQKSYEPSIQKNRPTLYFIGICLISAVESQPIFEPRHTRGLSWPRPVNGCVGIVIGVLQFILSVLSIGTFYCPYHCTKRAFSTSLLFCHFLFTTLAVVVLVVLFNMAHSLPDIKTELVRPESFYAVVVVFIIEVIFLLFSVIVLGLVTRKLVEPEQDFEE
ncbi:unnamed protein product, partial [Allacma fusca]